MPSLRDYILKSNLTNKATLEGYLKRHGHNTTQLWEQIDEIIVTLLIESEQQVIRESRKFKHPSKTFSSKK